MNNCLLYAISLVTGFSYEKCQKLIGHDGEELIDGHKRGFHIQEVIERIIVPWRFALTPIEFYPAQKWSKEGDEFIVLKDVYPVESGANKEIWALMSLELLERRDNIFDIEGVGILEGVKSNGVGHAYAKIGSEIFDQHGKYTIGELITKGFNFKCFWKLDRI